MHSLAAQIAGLSAPQSIKSTGNNELSNTPLSGDGLSGLFESIFAAHLTANTAAAQAADLPPQALAQAFEAPLIFGLTQSGHAAIQENGRPQPLHAAQAADLAQMLNSLDPAQSAKYSAGPVQSNAAAARSHAASSLPAGSTGALQSRLTNQKTDKNINGADLNHQKTAIQNLLPALARQASGQDNSLPVQAESIANTSAASANRLPAGLIQAAIHQAALNSQASVDYEKTFTGSSAPLLNDVFTSGASHGCASRQAVSDQSRQTLNPDKAAGFEYRPAHTQYADQVMLDHLLKNPVKNDNRPGDSVPLKPAELIAEIKTGAHQPADKPAISLPAPDALSAADKALNTDRPVLSMNASSRLNNGDDIAQQIAWAKQQNIHHIRLSVYPQHLGAVDISIEHDAGGINVQFLTQNMPAKEALEAFMPRLKEMLEQDGLNLQNASVGQQHNQQHNQQHKDNSACQQSRQADSSEVNSEQEPAQANLNAGSRQNFISGHQDYLLEVFA